MKRKCILYARFSPRPDADECESCAKQLEELREYAWKRGYEIVGQYSDEALSGGSDWNDRPGMFDAVENCEKGYLFLVRSYDRLFRDIEKAMMFSGMLGQQGVELRSITENQANGDSMTAKLVRMLFLWIAEYQREMIKARTRAAMLKHQANGRRMSARPPYGTRVDPEDNRRLIEAPEEREVIDKMVAMHAHGYSLCETCTSLNNQGILNRKGTNWHHEQVKRILVREKVL